MSIIHHPILNRTMHCLFVGCPGHEFTNDELDQMAAELLLAGWRRAQYSWLLEDRVYTFTQHAYAQLLEERKRS